jgi:hypothetical protein
MTLANDVTSIFNKNRFRLKGHIKEHYFENYQLERITLSIDWDEKALERTELGSEDLQIEIQEDGTLSCISPTATLEKFDADLDVGLEALAARGWKGHLVADCWMKKIGGEGEERRVTPPPPISRSVTPIRSEVGVGSDFIEDSSLVDTVS